MNYLAGESWFTVNGGYNPATRFDYVPGREYKQKYFRHIEWNKLEIPRLKRL